MKYLENIEVATLKKQIDLEIEKGNYEKVDSLTQILCEMQGLNPNGKMPKLFILKIIIKERMEKFMNTKKNISKVALVSVMLLVSGGVVYGATQHFRNVKHIEYGLTTESADVITKNKNNSDSDMKTFELPENNEEIKIISTEKGNRNVLWETKEVLQARYKGYKSDDGIKWEENTPDIVDIIKYSYKDYSKAIKDTDFKGLFTKTFEQNGGSVYTQGHHKENDIKDSDTLKSKFKYNNGSFEVEESRVLDWDGTEIDTVVISSSTEEVTNQREYTSKNGSVFKLSDDNEMDKLRTTVLVSYDEYTAVITFTDLSDKEIYEILDTVDIKK